jgi:GNAT superfamily N-acetyltransferase
MIAKPSIRIRRALGEDAPAVSAVLSGAFAEYRPLYTEEAYAATTVEGERLLARMRDGPVWVALHREAIVATTAATHREAGLYVRGMATLPSARGLGIGRLLLDHVERFARVGGYSQLFLRTTPFLRDAIRLYERFGFHALEEDPRPELFGTPLITMVKPLPT